MANGREVVMPERLIAQFERSKRRLEQLPPGYRPVVVKHTGCGCRWYEGVQTMWCDRHPRRCHCGHPGLGCDCW
jgi:hypothetical protein